MLELIPVNMKANILSFLLGIFIVISIAAAMPNTIITTKPEKPKILIVQTFGFQPLDDIKNFIIKYSKQGYAVKTVSIDMVSGGSSYINGGIVTMEKY